MSYLTKRKFALRPVLDKKKDIEQATSELKQKQEAEQTLLDQIKAELLSVGLELDEVNELLADITNGADNIALQVSDFILKARDAVTKSENVLNLYIKAIEAVTIKLQKKQEELNSVQTAVQSTLTALADEDARLEVKRSDIRIYEKRLRTKLEKSGMQDVIKLIFLD